MRMKRIKSIVLITSLVLLVSSCGSSTLKKAVEQGKLLIASGDYNEALSSLQLAKNEGARSDELETMIKILDKYINAKAAYDAGQYAKAQQEITAIPSEFSEYTINRDVDKLREDINKKLSENGSEEEADIEFVEEQSTQTQHVEDNTVKATYYVVNAEQFITLRVAPNENANEIVKIPWNAEVGYIGVANSTFYKIKYNGYVGYAKSYYLSPTPRSQSNNITTYAKVVNAKEFITLRVNPNENAAEILKIPANATVTFLSDYGNGFYKVAYNGYEGYAKAYYLQIQ